MKLQAIQIVLESGQEITAITKDLTDEESDEAIEQIGFSPPFEIPENSTIEGALEHVSTDGTLH